MKHNKGKKILISMYWSGRWQYSPCTAEDYEYAKNAGYLFDPPYPEELEEHEAALIRAKALVEKIDPLDVANAFLYSLSTRELEYRSALGSYYYAKAIPEHDSNHPQKCYVCGWSDDAYQNNFGNYNILNFERCMWGGVRHTNLMYALFDLEQFLKLPKVVPTQEDVAILREILACIGELEPRKKAGKLRDTITKKKPMKSNRTEIECLLNILGICGILAGEHHPCYEEHFVDEYDRAPQEHTNDMAYPVNYWRAEDGINAARFAKVFGFNL